MAEAWEKHPEDADVGAMYAESMMDLRPWDYWDSQGDPQPGTEALVAALEKVMTINPNHPLALHLYIHALEASPRAADAVAAADRLRTLQPGLGHMVHMPSHIDIRTGDWSKAIRTNHLAIAADEAYRRISPEQGFYRIYMAHNRHMLGFAAMMTGQSELAEKMIRQMVDAMPVEWVKENSLFVEGFVASPLEVKVRFGRWDEILNEPQPPDYLPITRCMWHKARAIAWAASDNVAKAEQEQAAFLEGRGEVSDEAVIGNNPAHNVLAVAEKLLAGEILYRNGKVGEAIAELEKGVALEDALRYDEPPDWINPVRHALGAILLKEKQFSKAEAVFRADLIKHPENGWSLFGLARSLEGQGRTDEASQVDKRFQAIWRDADIAIQTPCLCQQE
jgi:tetratricopeptide (TPR) repeat protein